MKALILKVLWIGLPLFLFISLDLVLYKVLMRRVNEFGCFDDCNNFMGGYFLLHGKPLFSEIFFNHNPGMAYLSEFIQWIGHPQNLSQLILQHRQFLFLFALIANVLLYVRFGYPAIIAATLFELTKFYISGDRFLAEDFLVYPMLFLVGLIWKRLTYNKIYPFDLIFSAIAAWFIIFMREPFVPVAICLYTTLLLLNYKKKSTLISLGLFIALTFFSIFYHNVQEFYFNVVTTNTGVTFAAENSMTGVFGPNAWKSFFYPIYLFFPGNWNFFRSVLLPTNIVFLLLFMGLLVKKEWKLSLFVFLALGIANLRIVRPGEEFYGAFHMINWYALFLFFSLLLIQYLLKNKKALLSIFLVFYLGMSAYVLFNKGSYVHDTINTQNSFIINYGIPLQVGNVVAALTTPKDSLFVDGSNDIVYFVAHRYSDYQYSWYTSLMPMFAKYRNARLEMFAQKPPIMYYGSCTKQKDPAYLLPDFVKNLYTRLLENGNPSCLWVRNDKIASITRAQWDKAKELLYTLP